MWRIFSYYLRVLYNFIWLPIWSVLNGGRIKYEGAQKISKKAILSLGKTGKIILGNRCMLEEGVLIHALEGQITLGKKVFINRNSSIVCHNGIEIGDYVTVGPNVCIYDHDHDLDNRNQFITKPIRIGDNTWIGAGVIILKGVTIGENSVIGAGTLVSKDVPANSVCYTEKNTRIITTKREKYEKN